MSGVDLRAARAALNMTQAQMGEHLARLRGRARPYSRNEVNVWENERGRGVPAWVEAALLRAQLEERKA